MSSPLSQATTTFDLAGVRLHALTWGRAGAPLALCLHGYPDTAWTWRHLGPALAERGYHVVAPFTRGYAPSTIPDDGDVSVGSRVADALGVAEQVGAEHAVVVGHDWGAFTAHALAAMSESPFRSFVSIAVPPLASIKITRETFLPRVIQTMAQSVNSWYIMVNQVPVVPERVFTPMTALLWRRWSPGYDAAEDLAHLAASAPTGAHRTAIIGYYRQVFRARQATHRELERLLMAPPRQPILQLYGSTDGCMRPSFFRNIDRHLPGGSRVVRIDGAGHFLHLEKPDSVHEIILDHLDG